MSTIKQTVNKKYLNSFDLIILQSNKLIMEFDTSSCCDSEEECDQNSSQDPVSAESILMMELGDHDSTFDPYKYKVVYCNFVKKQAQESLAAAMSLSGIITS